MKKRRFKEGDMVEVLWDDSSFTSEVAWHNLDDLDWDNCDRLLIISVGYLVQKDNKIVGIVQSRGYDNSLKVMGTLQIPVGAIRSIRKLEYKSGAGKS